ncbi:spermidine synthase [Syncephalis fuscata]|nr:spermidine synthase [Syncephalis fuscata]
MSQPITHECIVDGWFREKSVLWPGQAMAIQVEEVLHHEKSLYQDVLVFKSTTYGTVLVLDGVIQATERDEFAYQEMIAHLPMMSHPNPRKVLVIGGGDGGVIREIVKHDCVEEVVLCDIDEAVIRVSKQYLPSMAVGFQHPKVTVHIGDGFEFMKNNQEEFDVIITDSSDPVGPAESLFQRQFYELMNASLRNGGIISTQGECMWLHLNLIKEVLDFSRTIYPSVAYAYASVPTYPSGQIGFIIASKDASLNLQAKLCRYYNARVHETAFVLPQFAHAALLDDKTN